MIEFIIGKNDNLSIYRSMYSELCVKVDLASTKIELDEYYVKAIGILNELKSLDKGKRQEAQKRKQKGEEVIIKLAPQLETIEKNFTDLIESINSKRL